MKVAFDASFLTLLFTRGGNASVPFAADRIDGLIDLLTEKKAKIIIPTPALTEILIKLPRTGPSYIERLKPYGCFQIRPFDEKAAVELATTLRDKSGRPGVPPKKTPPASKIKFDRQIVAIAKAHGAEIMYSDDGDLVAFAKQMGLDGVMLADLDVPQKQHDLFTQFGIAQIEQSETQPPASLSAAGDKESGV